MRNLITDDVEAAFDLDVVDRGYEYFEQRRVVLLNVSRGSADARVMGTRSYRVRVEFDDEGIVLGDCNCPAYERFGPCKHLFATLLELGERATRERATRAPARRPHPLWRQRLDRMEAARNVFDPWTDVAGAGVRAFFLLNVERTERDGAVHLAMRYRRRLKNGSWSKPKTLRPFAGGARMADSATNELIVRALSADPAQAYWMRHRQDYYPGVGRVGELDLPSPLAPSLLREMAGRGLLYRSLDEQDEPRPVVLDEGPPWELTLVLDAVRGKRWRLCARFVRGDESMPLEEAELILGGGVLIANGRLADVRLFGAMEWVAELRSQGDIEVPGSRKAELIRAVVEGPGDADLRIEGLNTIETPKPRPLLDLDFEAATVRVPCDVSFLYGGERIEAAAPGMRIVNTEAKAIFVRDIDEERRALARFLELGGREDGVSAEAQPWLPRGEATRVAIALLGEGWSVSHRGSPWRTADGFDFRVASGLDWFELSGGLRFDDEEVGFPAILRALESGAGHVELADGSLGMLPDDTSERVRMLGVLGGAAGENLRFARSQGWLLDSLLGERDEVTADADFARLRERLDAFAGIRPAKARRGFRGTLRPYQREALGWFEFLAEMGLGGCLADDMGLGKTIMVLAMLHARQVADAASSPALVVAPKSLVWNWIEEAERFAPKLRVLDYTGPKRKTRLEAAPDSDLMVTTYGVLRRDVTQLKEIGFSCAVLDEAQAIKNPASQAAKASRLLKAERRLALTGTPVENHLGDLWSLMEFLNPGMLGSTKTFRAWSGGATPTADERARLASAIRPVLLRRTKDQVLSDLPKRSETTLHCEMGPRQAKAYRELAAHYRKALLGASGQEDLGRFRIQILEALLRLRQVACHPGLVDDARAGEDSAKLDLLVPMLEELRESGHKALVFSQFTSFLALLRDRLDGAGLRYAYLDGRTRKRKEVVDRFQEDADLSAFLISLKAGGVGLNLTAANYVFLLDPWWNPAVECQAIDRAHRIGQARPVTAYRLVCKGTVEDRILELQEKKRELADAIVRADAGPLKSLTRGDLEFLFRAGG